MKNEIVEEKHATSELIKKHTFSLCVGGFRTSFVLIFGIYNLFKFFILVTQK